MVVTYIKAQSWVMPEILEDGNAVGIEGLTVTATPECSGNVAHGQRSGNPVSGQKEVATSSCLLFSISENSGERVHLSGWSSFWLPKVMQ
jgi:hypothetical protein